MSRDRLFTLAFFWNVFTDLYLMTAIEKKVSGKSRSRDIYRWMEIRLKRDLKIHVYGKPLTASGKRQTANFKLYFDVNS